MIIKLLRGADTFSPFKRTADLVDSNQYLFVKDTGGSINTYTKGTPVSITGITNGAGIFLVNVTDASTFQVSGYGNGGYGFGITNSGEFVTGLHNQVVDATNYKYAGMIIAALTVSGSLGFTVT